MTSFLLHFVLGLLGALAIFLLFLHLSATDSTSAPFGLLLIALPCGVLGSQLSAWATPAILLLYALVSWSEYRQEMRMRREAEQRRG